jgi:hypothetical protein
MSNVRPLNMDLATVVAEGRRIFMIQAIALLVFFAPILVSAFLVVFKGRHVRGRWLFLLVGPLVVYTILWLAMLVFMVPAWFVLTWFTPAVVEIVNNTPFWYPFYSWVAKYDGYIASTVCFGLSIWLVGHFWPRWPKILEALAAPKSERPRSE